MTDTPKHHRQRDLLAYVQDFLDPDERRDLEEHMKGCADCQKTLGEVQKFLPSLQKALTPQEMSTQEMWSKVQRQARNLPPAKEPFFTRIRLAFAVSGAALATTVLIVLQPLLQQVESGAVAKRQQQPASGIVSSPHRPESGIVGSPHRPDYAEDAGPDGGMPEEDGGE